MEYCDCSSMAVSHGVNLYGFKDAVINCIWVDECVQPQTPVYRDNGVALTEVAPGSTKGRGQANEGHQKGVWHFILCC